MRPLSSRAAFSGAASPEDDTQELAKNLSNPIALLISVPFQFNYDEGYGPNDGEKACVNIQPVIPVSLNAGWNMISRTIVPVIWQNDIAGPSGEQFGLGDGSPLRTAVIRTSVPRVDERNFSKKQKDTSMNARTLNRMLIAMTVAMTTFPVAVASAADAITEEEAHAIGVDAYVYFYPLLSMDVTRMQLTNVEAKQGAIGGPPNRFNNIPEFPPADMKVVVRPNFDTLYSSAWLDLTKEPVVVSAPDTGGRYYLLPMLDMWTDVFAAPGWRTTGTGAGHFLIAPPGWRPDLRDKFDEFNLPDGTARIDAPTPYVWIIGRTKTDGPHDYDAVHKIQDGYKITLLSEWGKEAQPAEIKIDQSVDMKTPPKTQVDSASAGKYFAYAAELLKLNPPHITDQPILARMKRIGIEPGKSFDLSKADPVVQKALATVPQDAQALMGWKLKTLARIANGWSMNTDTMGVYGNYYLKRAIVSQQGLGANLPEDAIYPLNLADESGQTLDGKNAYTIHFEKSELPPVNAFWSVTLYDNKGFQVANSLNRFAVSSWMPFQYNADGSLDLYFQNESPGKDKEGNWLPAPEGPYNLTMRLYGPKPDALTGKWNPPAVIKSGAVPALAAQ